MCVVTTGLPYSLIRNAIDCTNGVTIEFDAFCISKIEFEPIVVDKDHLLIAEAPPGVDRLIVEGQHTLIDGQPVHVLGAPLASQRVIAPDAGSLPSP